MANELLNELNAFRAQSNLAPFADWRKARHMPMLEQYRANAEKLIDTFEASAEELAKQTVRPTADEELNIETRPMTDEEVDATAKLAAMHAQVDELKATTEETAEDLLRAATHDDFAGNKGVQNAAREIAKTKSYKQVAHYGKSTVDKPVGFIHQFLSDNPGMTRKEAVIALTEGYGVNYSTARTQYQRWYSANKKAK